MESDTRRLLWNTTALLFSYMAVAMPLPVISVFVTNTIGFSNSLGGFAVGITYLAAILSRSFAGRLADDKGGKTCMIRGLILYAAASAVCSLAGLTADNAPLAYALLITGRFILGLGESLTLVGMLSWNIALMGTHRSSVVFSLVGAILFGAFAAGGPLGMLALDRFGFSGLMLCCCPLPLIGAAMLLRVTPARPETQSTRKKEPFFRIMALIWRQGVMVGAQAVGFAALGAFIALYFAEKNWPYVELALPFYGGGFVLVRILGSRWPARFGGVKTAMISLAVEAFGQLLLWQAPTVEIALVGTFLTGIGCSLVFPSMGMEVIRQVQPGSRGIALGGFEIFQDVALGATAPVTGSFADHFGYPVVFLFGLAAAGIGLLVGVTTVRQNTERNGKAP